MAVDAGVLRERRAKVLQLGFLLIARDGDARPLPGRDALLQGRVVEPVTQAKHTPKFPLVGGSGLGYGWLFHRSLFCLIGTKLAKVRLLAETTRLTAWAKARFCQKLSPRWFETPARS
jgi:hypothetical protein